MTTSLNDELEEHGFLSVHKTVKYIEQYHPIAKVSYGTLRKLIDEGRVIAVYPDQRYRTKIEKTEIERFIRDGPLPLKSDTRINSGGEKSPSPTGDNV